MLPRCFYDRDPVELAPLLLNKLLVLRGSADGPRRAVRIVEVEAYRGQLDPASHARRGPTARNATMFGRGGHLYVYFTYGMHWCANVVAGPPGTAGAVLVRAGAPVASPRGRAAMWAARPGARRAEELAAGPARLCQALGISGLDDGADLVAGDRGLILVDDGVAPPADPRASGRVGIRRAVEQPWRFWVPGDPHVSPGRPGPPSGSRSAAEQPGSGPVAPDRTPR